MRVPMPWRIAIAALALLALTVALLPGVVERQLNPVMRRPPYPAPMQARALARDAVDLHADPLLWGRDLLERGARGQIDVPRLQDVDAAVQVFGVVTQVPRGRSYAGNSPAALDTITPLSILSLWPPQTWLSLRERALWQARRLREMAEKSAGALVLLRSRADLEILLHARAAGSRAVGALLALEGSQALQGDLGNLDALYDAGFRIASPAHFLDTDIAGSAHGARKGGLTRLGRQWLTRLEQKRMIADLAHASPQAVDDVLAAATRPVIVSHTGVKATCDGPRNLDDGQLRALAKNGALVGIGVWREAVCGKDAHAVARAMRHAADVMGIEHVALGTDFDGAIAAPFDVTGLPMLAAALREERFSDAEIRAVLSQNALRFLGDSLP